MNKQDINRLNTVRQYIQIPEITNGQIYAITEILIKQGYFYVPRNRRKLDYLIKFLLDADMFTSGISIFKDTYLKYMSIKQQKRNDEEFEKLLDIETKRYSEENMEYISDMLLKQDEVYF